MALVWTKEDFVQHKCTFKEAFLDLKLMMVLHELNNVKHPAYWHKYTIIYSRN